MTHASHRAPGAVIRCDASSRIGHGHVVRCLALATALAEQGMAVSFICREHPGNLCDLIARSFAVHRLAATGRPVVPDPAEPHAEWLDAPWEVDAAETLAALTEPGFRPDWLIVDHYAIDKRWEARLRPHVQRLMVIDDLADRDHDCDVLLDQNFGATLSGRYAARVPSTCSLLLGPEYALLHATYADLHQRTAPREGAIRRLFVWFGGADRTNLTGRALTAIATIGREEIGVDVVLVAGSIHEEAVRGQARQMADCRIHHGLPTLAPLMAGADLAIGAAGTTSLERLCLGLPAVVITVAENQRPGAAAMSALGLIRWLGDADEVDDALLTRALHDIIARGADSAWSRRCLESVDGRGSARVAELLSLSEATPLRVRLAAMADEALLLRWANDAVVRRNSFSPEPITAVAHHAWLSQRLRDVESYRLYIVETEAGTPVGQVRFDRVGDAWRIDYALSAGFRGRGLGRSLLHTALGQLSAYEPGAVVFGEVKGDNHPSRRVFESLGFSAHEADDVVRYQRAAGAPSSGFGQNTRRVEAPGPR